MGATFSNNHYTPVRYIIQIYHPSFDDEPMYLSKCGKAIWNIGWDPNIWKAKTFKYEKLAKREAYRCKNLIIEGAQKGWTTLGYIVTEDGKYDPKFKDVEVRVLKVKIDVIDE